MFIPVTRRLAAYTAYAAGGVNLAASLFMFLFLRSGLAISGTTLNERMAYVNSHKVVWCIGWLIFHVAAVGLLGFYLTLASQWNRKAPLLTTLAMICSITGMAINLAAEAIYMNLMHQSDRYAFFMSENIAGFMTGYLGNGLYTIAGILLTVAGLRELPKELLALGATVWISGLSFSISTLTRSMTGQFWSTAFMMTLLFFWSFLVGKWFTGQTPES